MSIMLRWHNRNLTKHVQSELFDDSGILNQWQLKRMTQVSLLKTLLWLWNEQQYGCFESFPFSQKNIILVRQITWFRWNSWHRTSSVNVHNKKLQSSCTVLTFDSQLKKIIIFSVKGRYQLNYFICIKYFNAETNTSFKLNLFSFSICGCQHHQRKTICLYVYISGIRQIVGYQTLVFIQRFPWRLHITITYNLPHLRLWYADVVMCNSINTGSLLPICSDVKTRKRRNVVGIDTIRNNRIEFVPYVLCSFTSGA